MSERIFDKHIEFCEKYMGEVQDIIISLINDGPTEKGREYYNNLLSIRIQYSAWISNDITNSLLPFETAVFQIGSQARLSQSTSKPDVAQKAADKAEKLWEEILGQLIDENSTDNSIAANSIKNRLRDILGIDKLSKLRNELIDQAIRSLEVNT